MRIGGENFIEAKIRQRYELHPGREELAEIRTRGNVRTASHSNEQVKNRAYSLISTKPKIEMQEKDVATETDLYTVRLGPNTRLFEYHYKILECDEGVWYFSLRRFADRIKIMIERAEGYQYEYLPLGGFPSSKLEEDEVLSHITLMSDEVTLPHQGLLLHWYRRRSS